MSTNLFKPTENTASKDNDSLIENSEFTQDELNKINSYIEDKYFLDSLQDETNISKNALTEMFSSFYVDRLISNQRSETLEVNTETHNVKFLVTSKFGQIDKERADYLEEKGYKGLTDIVDTVSLNTKLLDKQSISKSGKFKDKSYSEVLSMLISDCNAIAPEDKNELFKVSREYKIRKTFFDSVEKFVKEGKIDSLTTLENLIFRYAKPQTQIRVKEVD